MPDSATTGSRFAYAADHALARAGDGYFTWLDHIWHAAACTHPIRLRGQVQHIDPATGELLRTVITDTMPDQVMYKPCGNRRATTCPGCAETYRRDAYHLIRAGLIGGKGITPAVATHPAVFATFTAPSFGPVHTRPVRQHTCTDRTRCTCQPQPCHARRNPGRCEHGRHNACFTRHHRDDTRLGQPLCPDCYDYTAHVVWNNQAGELWRRTKQAIERHLGQLARRRGVPPIRVPCGNGTSPPGRPGPRRARQSRRIPGPRRGPLPRPAPPRRLRPRRPGHDPPSAACHHRRRPRGRHPPRRRGHQLPAPSRTRPSPAAGSSGWGDELDVRVITMRGTGTITDLAVASYLAKYSTKGTETTGHASARLTTETIDLYANPAGTHPERLIAACWRLGRHPDHTSLRRWAHMLGFGGHFLTKARRYSIRFRDLRQARIIYRRTHDTGPEHGPIRAADHADDETTLIIGTLTYAGAGWTTSGDALLANTAADQARKRREAGREELADEYNRAGTRRWAA